MPSPPPLRRRNGTLIVAPLAAGVLIVLLLFLAISGHWPEFGGLVQPSAKGLIAITPSDVTRVEIRSGRDTVALHRGAGSWVIDSPGETEAVPTDVASHVRLTNVLAGR